MAVRTVRVIPVVFAFCFSLIAFVFSLLAITSRDWALRDYYETVIPEDWKQPNFTIARSPFHLCSTRPAFERFNGATEDEEPFVVLVGYNTTCTRYPPFGFNRTSCELRSVTETDNASVNGDARLCQQIHYAGNFGISSATFISLGFILTLGLTVSTAYRLFSKDHKSQSTTTSSAGQYGGKDNADESVHAVAQHDSTRAERYRRHIVLGNVSFVTVLFLCLGVVLALISQFYGVLAFIQSAPNNSDWASSAAGNSQDVNSNIEGFHGPWYQGPALSVYWTCAWGFAAASAAVASRAWTMPRWAIDH